MMKTVSRSTTLLLLATTLLCQYPIGAQSEKDAEIEDALYQRYYSFMQDANPSPAPPRSTFEAIAAGAGNAQHSIKPDKFTIGYAAEGTYFAPNKGRVSFNFWNDAKRQVVLHVDARYNWHSNRNRLVLNTFTGGRWQKEDHPAGYDFTPGVLVKVRIEALHNYWRIICNGKDIQHFPYRGSLRPMTVNRIQMSFEDFGNANPKADLKSLSVHYDIM